MKFRFTILIGFLASFDRVEANTIENDKTFFEFQKVKHYLISIEPQLAGVFPQGDKVWTFVRKGRVYVESLYNEKASDPDLGFGTLKNPMEGSTRIELAEGEKDRRIRAAWVSKDDHFFLDSAKRQVLHWDVNHQRWLSPIDIVMDLMRPPADARGEAPTAEILRTRSRFLKSYRMRVDDPDFIIGMTKIPEHWKDKEGNQSLVLLKHPDYPLVTLSCQTEDKRTCRFQRVCFIPKFTASDVENFAGISYRASSQEIWIATNNPPRIHRFRGGSCLGLQKRDIQLLPSELRALSGIAIDEKDRLWITTRDPDLKHSASLFVWDLMSLR